MKAEFLILLFIWILLFVGGCASNELLRNSTMVKYNLSPEELKLVQYYITAPVYLTYTETKEEKGVTTENTLSLAKSTYEKEIVIDAGTEGAATKTNDNELIIAFDKDIHLGFEPQKSDLEAPYVLKSFNEYPLTKNNIKVIFRNKECYLRYFDLPMLYYEFTNEFYQKKEREKVKGFTVKELQKLEMQKLETEYKIKTDNKNIDTLKYVPTVNNRSKLYHFIFNDGTELDLYIIENSENFLYVSDDPTSRELPTKVAKEFIKSFRLKD